jgi:hypothetical protein
VSTLHNCRSTTVCDAVRNGPAATSRRRTQLSGPVLLPHPGTRAPLPPPPDRNRRGRSHGRQGTGRPHHRHLRPRPRQRPPRSGRNHLAPRRQRRPPPNPGPRARPSRRSDPFNPGPPDPDQDPLDGPPGTNPPREGTKSAQPPRGHDRGVRAAYRHADLIGELVNGRVGKDPSGKLYPYQVLSLCFRTMRLTTRLEPLDSTTPSCADT